MKPKDVVKWSEMDWRNRVRYMLPSSGGAVGVVFVWVDNSPPRPPNPSTSQFVIKPIRGSAAPTKFAELVLREVAGAISPHTKGIKHSPNRGHGRGAAIEERLKVFKDNERNPDIRFRWNQVWPHYQQATCYLIQETQTAIREFGEEYLAAFGLHDMLLNRTLMENLGKLFVADAMIGNGDRLFKFNSGNILFKGDTYKLCAIDSATILSNYRAVLNDQTRLSWTDNRRKPTREAWAKGIVNPGPNIGNAPLAVLPPDRQHAYIHEGQGDGIPTSFPVEHVFHAGMWYDNEFKQTLMRSLETDHLQDQIPAEYVWNNGKTFFLQGVDIGMREVDRVLSGLNWLSVKLNYKKYVSKYGGDPNLDWTNFKVRRLYYRLRRKGVNEEQAMAQVAAYVRGKLHLQQ